MSDVPTEDDLAQAARSLARKLLEMYDLNFPGIDPDQPTPGAHGVRARIDGFRRDYEGFVLFDPQKITEEYGRMLDVAKRTGDNPHAVADFAETHRFLAPWTGLAADAFARQVTLMSEYCELQQTNIAQALQGLLMMGQLAIRARLDYMELVAATIAAADREISGQSTRDAKASTAIVSLIVEKAIEVNPSTLLTSGLSMLTAIGAKLADDMISGDDRDDILDNYCGLRDRQRLGYEVGLAQVRKFLNDRLSEVVSEGHPFKEPLPTYCDVDGPDFSYEKFYPRRDTAPVNSAPMVAEERRIYVEEKRSSDSEINRRLDGNRGAV